MRNRKLVSIRKAAAALDLCEVHLRTLIRRGKIPAYDFSAGKRHKKTFRIDLEEAKRIARLAPNARV